MTRSIFTVLGFGVLLVALAGAQKKAAPKASAHSDKKASLQPADPHDKQALLQEALSAAPADLAKNVTVKDWDGNVLKDGSGPYTCFPTPPAMRKMGREPMCLDKTWQAWADAWMNKKEFKADQVAIAYMLEGDTGASNTDPYATGKTDDNQWVVSGPHTMVLVPDPAALDGLPTDPSNGGPWVMWKGSPFAHIMVPVEKQASGGATMHMHH